MWPDTLASARPQSAGGCGRRWDFVPSEPQVGPGATGDCGARGAWVPSGPRGGPGAMGPMRQGFG